MANSLRITTKELTSESNVTSKLISSDGEPLKLKLALAREYKDDSSIPRNSAAHMFAKSMQGYQLIVASRASDHSYITRKSKEEFESLKTVTTKKVPKNLRSGKSS